jgi:hypothetical protein
LSDPDTFIGHFNRAEAAIWFLVALVLPFVVTSQSRKQRVAVLAASLGFVLFGITDLLEAARVGNIPAWLWAFKITCAAYLLACRFLYIGRRNIRLNDRWLLFGLFCLIVSALLIKFG